MGGGRSADGGGHSSAISRPRRRLGAIGLGGRVGPRCARTGRAVFLFSCRDRLALDVCDRRSAGAARLLSAPLCDGAGNGGRFARKPDASRQSAADLGNLLRSRSEDHGTGVLDGDRLPGRLLRGDILGAAFPHDGPQAVDRLFNRLSFGADHRLVRRLSRRRLARRPDRPAQSVPDLFDWRDHGRAALHAVALANDALWALGFPLGFFASGYFSGVGAFLTELYPTRLCGSGQGFCYNFGRGIGALFPFLVGALSNSTSLANAIAIFAVAAYAVFFLAAYALPETRGRVLHAET